jgi:hypothetical protein
MIEALIAGETNPAKLASLADRRVKASPEELREALRGRVTKHHRFLLRLHLNQIDALVRQTVEHPFGTIKAWMGATHFQMRRLTKVASEMALHVLAYNMKRVMQILGVGGLMAAMRA